MKQMLALLAINPLFTTSMAMLGLIAAVIAILVLVYKKKYKEDNPYEDNKGTTFDREFVVAHTINDYVYDPENLPIDPT